MKEQTEKGKRLIKAVEDKLGLGEGFLDPDKTWAENGLDSLDTLEAVMVIEKEFFITIPDEVSHTLDTPSAAIAYIEKNG